MLMPRPKVWPITYPPAAPPPHSANDGAAGLAECSTCRGAQKLQSSIGGVIVQNVPSADAPWGMRRMEPLRNGEASPWQYAGLDPQTQTGRWIGGDGQMTPAELGKHGTSVNTYPPTQLSKDGKQDSDSGHDATQD